MKLELFTNKGEFEEYLKIANLSMGSAKTVGIRFRKEMERALEFTLSLKKNFDIFMGHRILYALRGDNGEIIGTVAVSEDAHCSDFVQIEYVAVKKDLQSQGLGKFMMDEVHKEIAKHSKKKMTLLSTITKGAFYENCGMEKAGTLKVGERTKLFYSKKI